MAVKPPDPGNTADGPDRTVAHLIGFAREKGFTITTAAIVRAAEQRGIPWTALDPKGLLLLGEGQRKKLINGTLTSQTARSAVIVASDKRETNRVLFSAGLPVPRQTLVGTADEAVRSAEQIGYPVVVKPRHGNQGRGVSVRLSNSAEVSAATEIATGYSDSVLIEQYIAGWHNRLLVINGDFIAAARLAPPQVVGDGLHTVDELVQLANRDARRGKEHENVLTCLEIDRDVISVLAKQRCSVTTVPGQGEAIMLRTNSNLSTGGTSRDVTEDVHPDHREMAARAVRAVGLDVGGVDFICSDISAPYSKSGGAICEVNPSPGLRMHLAPAEGLPRDVAGPILDVLFRSLDDAHPPESRCL